MARPMAAEIAVPSMLDDATIRAALFLRWRRRLEPDQFIIEELALRGGFVRADLSIVGSGMHGVEVKSDADSLFRLSTQIVAYTEVFDSITLVTTERHRVAALEILPDCWGLVLAASLGTTVEFEEIRTPLPNPDVCTRALTKLLWKDELSSLAASCPTFRSDRRMSRQELQTIIADQLSRESVQKAVRRVIMQRNRREPDERRTQYGDSCRPEAMSSGYPFSRAVAPSTKCSGRPD